MATQMLLLMTEADMEGRGGGGQTLTATDALPRTIEDYKFIQDSLD